MSCYYGNANVLEMSSPSEQRCLAVKITVFNMLHNIERSNSSPLLRRSRQALKVREHKVLGPYVDGLSRLAVASYKVRVWYRQDEQRLRRNRTVTIFSPRVFTAALASYFTKCVQDVFDI